MKKQMSRKQFLGTVAGGMLGVLGVFRVLEDINNNNIPTNDLATSNNDVFGERKYGGDAEPVQPHTQDHGHSY